jgi:hypothetical protein
MAITVALGSPANNAAVTDTTPDLTFTGTDTSGFALDYQIQVDTTSTFDSTNSLAYSLWSGSPNAGYPIRGNTTNGYAQSFQASNNESLYSASFMLSKDATATGTFYYALYAHTGTFGVDGTPTGTALAQSETYESADLSTSSTEITLYFTGTNQIQLNSGTYYFIAIEYSGTVAYIWITVAQSDRAPGNVSNKSSSAWYVSYPGYDVWYKVYTANPLISSFSTDHTGFSAGASHPTTSGVEQTYTVQSVLPTNKYYWRARANAPGNGGVWGAWSPGDSTLGYDSFSIPLVVATIDSSLNFRVLNYLVEGAAGEDIDSTGIFSVDTLIEGSTFDFSSTGILTVVSLIEGSV